MRNEVTITITGIAGCGKTAIAQIIYDALNDRGINIDSSPSETAIGRRTPFELGVTIGSLQANGLGVTIVEQISAKRS